MDFRNNPIYDWSFQTQRCARTIKDLEWECSGECSRTIRSNVRDHTWKCGVSRQKGPESSPELRHEHCHEISLPYFLHPRAFTGGKFTRKNPPPKRNSSEQVFLNNFCWVPDSPYREKGKSSRELFEKVRVNAVFFWYFRILSGSEKGVFWKRGLFQKSPFLEILESPQTVENKGKSDHFLEILENLEILEILEIPPVETWGSKMPLK